jgi:hypothetical protein
MEKDKKEFKTNKKNFFKARKDIQEGIIWVKLVLEVEEIENSQELNEVKLPVINN